MASDPSSIRLSAETRARVDEVARITGESSSAIIRRYVDEGSRMERCPGIVFRGGPAGRRPGIAQGPDVWEVIAALRQRDSDLDAAIATVAAELALTTPLVRSAVRYYAEFPQEIDAWIARNDSAAEAQEAAWHRERLALAPRPR